MNKTKGFTLIELLVVIAIIGILASVVLVSLQSARKKGNDSRIISSVSQIRVALESNYSAGSNYPDLRNTAGPQTLAAGNLTSTNIQTLLTDITTNQTAGGVASPVRYAAISGSEVWQDGSVVITKDGSSSSSGKGYAIYAKLPSGGVFCIDGTGKTTSTATFPTAAPTSANGMICI